MTINCRSLCFAQTSSLLSSSITQRVLSIERNSYYKSRTRHYSTRPMAMADYTKGLYPHNLKSLSKGQTTMADAMRRLGTEFAQVPLTESMYVKPHSIMFKFDDKPRRWDIVEAHPSVHVLIYHTGMRAFLLVRQFRPAVYATALRIAAGGGQDQPHTSAGFAYELCAGLVDKTKELMDIAREEVEEECGYKVRPDAISLITTSVSGIGASGSLQHIYYVEVDESCRVNEGGGLAADGECIEVLALPLESATNLVLDNTIPKSPNLMFGVMWALHTRPGALGRQVSGLYTDAMVLNPVISA